MTTASTNDRHIEHAVSLADDTTLAVNRFQRRFWAEVEASDWVSFSAPTSAGKSFIVTHWLVDFVRRHPSAMVVYLASEHASATTGAALRVDGGLLRSIV